jgi:hypothetical protein
MSDKMKIKNTKGLCAGVIAWIIFVFWFISDSSCIKYPSCDGGDLFSMAIVAVSSLAPAWIVACFASDFFEDIK